MSRVFKFLSRVPSLADGSPNREQCGTAQAFAPAINTVSDNCSHLIKLLVGTDNYTHSNGGW